MKKKIVIGLLALSVLMCGCEPASVNINMQNTEQIHSTQIGRGAFKKIGKRLYYDEATRIVYIFHASGNSGYLSAYYAPNGLPYKYNPETNTLEEILCQQ